MVTDTRKRIHHACLRNLGKLLRGEISYEEWLLGQQQLESRLGRAPELPFAEEQPLRTERSRAA